MPAGKISYITAIVLLVFAIGGAYLLVKTKPQNRAVIAPQREMQVISYPLQSTAITPSIELFGSAEPVNTTQLAAAVTATVTQRLVDAGDKVEIGQLLMQLDTADLQQQIAKIDAQIEQEQIAIRRDQQLVEIARQTQQLQQDEVERLSQLGKQSLSSASQLDNSKQRQLQLQTELITRSSAVTAAKARLDGLRADRTRLQIAIQKSAITAPFSGVVDAVFAKESEWVNSGKTLISLFSPNETQVTLHLSVTKTLQLSIGETIALHSYSQKYQGRVTAISLLPDSLTNNRAITIQIDNQFLPPGTMVRVAIPLQTIEKSYMVPKKAMLFETEGSYLFVIKDNQLHKTAVKVVANSNNGYICSSANLADSVIIVAQDVAALTDQQRVVVSQTF